MRLIGLAVGAFWALSAGAAAQEGDVDRGKAIAEQRCARCHAVGQTDESRIAKAPPLRTLPERYPLETLEEAFAEGVEAGHPGLPQIRLTPEQIVDLLSYIAALSEG